MTNEKTEAVAVALRGVARAIEELADSITDDGDEPQYRLSPDGEAFLEWLEKTGRAFSDANLAEWRTRQTAGLAAG